MSEYLIDDTGNINWYDLKSEEYNPVDNIFHLILYENKLLYVRLHRENAPALIWPDGSEFYFIHGKCHRDDGPAMIYTYGALYWYLDGIEYSFEDWCIEMNKSPEEITFLKLKWKIT